MDGKAHEAPALQKGLQRTGKCGGREVVVSREGYTNGLSNTQKRNVPGLSRVYFGIYVCNKNEKRDWKFDRAVREGIYGRVWREERERTNGVIIL